MQDNGYINGIIERFQQGNATQAEKELLLQYLEANQQDDYDQLYLALMDELWEKEEARREESVETAAEFAALLKQIPQTKKKTISLHHIWRYAAAVLLLCFMVQGWFYFQRAGKPVEAAIQWSVQTTVEGQKKKIRLSDSSVIYLAGGSTLRWPNRFVKGEKREVILEGEAFFEIKRDTTSPFIVHSSQISTQVLGTSFNIYAYPEDKNQVIAVRSGKVRVVSSQENQHSKLADLTAGMRLTYHQETKDFSVEEKQDPRFFGGWIENRLSFQNANLEEITKKIGRYYNVTFDLQGQCKNDKYRINANFENQPIRSVMEQLVLMSGGNIKYRINTENSITLWRKECR